MALHTSASGLRGGAASPQVLDRAFLADSITAYQQRAFNEFGPRPRSVARRVKQRLVLGVAALVLFGLSGWFIPDESSGTTSSTDSPPIQRREKSQDRVASVRSASAIQSTPR